MDWASLQGMAYLYVLSVHGVLIGYNITLDR